MDVHSEIWNDERAIKTVDMHTSGEPTRIIVQGYPSLEGETLLDMRRCAAEKHDDIRKMLMFEPRGHGDMYGAILVKETEMTKSGNADIGVLFCHNEGYSTMCGHATIALGRFLVDTEDEGIFPLRKRLVHDEENDTVKVRLHAPCGVVQVTVPVTCKRGKVESDSSKAVEFLGVPSFVKAKKLEVSIGVDKRWKGLIEKRRETVQVDVAYGGAYYAIVSLEEMGIEKQGRGYDMKEMDKATAEVKRALWDRKDIVKHPTHGELEYLYGVIVVEREEGRGEIGICFFANQQIDRSPCGSGVCARVALGVEKGEIRMGEGRDFYSFTTEQGFRGTAVSVEDIETAEGVIRGYTVKVEGKAYYTGAHSFLLEHSDLQPPFRVT
ncbi:hypothetical protein JAAARDRAFT_686985 [Jaapia argillacea MUCL 33604]|uniref:trans-L-3-hydroxyproline dehydratase n=1 Tax=Jaapia argillacea MUCL 33604 TaxID=933084 RepID=A0A067PRV0_9AGAM|nr:hypothetical protein JAAARDRAFT_686985 [Jaapia argillacea MUCL 33604]